jgi:hypothetical protein
MKDAPESPNPMLVFRNCGVIVAKSMFGRLSSVSVWLTDPSGTRQSLYCHAELLPKDCIRFKTLTPLALALLESAYNGGNS